MVNDHKDQRVVEMAIQQLHNFLRSGRRPDYVKFGFPRGYTEGGKEVTLVIYRDLETGEVKRRSEPWS